MEEARRDPRPDGYDNDAPHLGSPWKAHEGGTQTFDERRQRRDHAGRRQQLEALRALGPVVYAARVGDQIKIGHTGDLATRLAGLHADTLLAFIPGTYEDEQATHRGLADHLHHGREWYYPTPKVMSVVNEMRDALGLEPLAV